MGPCQPHLLRPSHLPPLSLTIFLPPPLCPPPQVCECLILFMERNEEEFAKFLQTFTQDVWTQLMKVSQAPGQVRGLRLHLWGTQDCAVGVRV